MSGISLKRLFFVFFFLLFLTIGVALFQQGVPTSKIYQDEHTLQLQVPLDESAGARESFSRDWRRTNPKKLRPVYEKYIGTIGANGIINELERLRPNCHDEGHDLGKVIYVTIGSIGPALRTCEDACSSGCMHGVLMAAFAEDENHTHPSGTPEDHTHVELPTLRAAIHTICDEEALTDLYIPGDCAHGVGHASMYLSFYNISRALDHCLLFSDYPMVYYCTTGAYMEYNTNRHIVDRRREDLFFPCDRNRFPAACFRYKLVHVAREYPGQSGVQQLAEECLKLTSKYRWGCFHGLGNAYTYKIADGILSYDDVCGLGDDDDQYACIEGAIERMAKYRPGPARESCDQLTGWRQDLCVKGVENKMYALDKPFTLYLE